MTSAAWLSGGGEPREFVCFLNFAEILPTCDQLWSFRTTAFWTSGISCNQGANSFLNYYFILGPNGPSKKPSKFVPPQWVALLEADDRIQQQGYLDTLPLCSCHEKYTNNDDGVCVCSSVLISMPLLPHHFALPFFDFLPQYKKITTPLQFWHIWL